MTPEAHEQLNHVKAKLDERKAKLKKVEEEIQLLEKEYTKTEQNYADMSLQLLLTDREAWGTLIDELRNIGRMSAGQAAKARALHYFKA